MKSALAIAGSDCSGGAGIQADLKTFTAHRVYGMTIITAIVAENTTGVIKIEDVSPDMIDRQFEAVFEDIFPDSVKIGMLSEKETIESVIGGLRRYRPHNVIADPVLYAKDSTPLMNEDCMELLINGIIPLTDLITPNIPEAEKISGLKIRTEKDIRACCEAIYNMGCGGVLIKGGHSEGAAVDVLFDGKQFFSFTSPRIHTKNTHGTGCTLSSAIAANMAKGASLYDAVCSAKAYITGAIENSLALGKGNGPLNHMHNI